MLCEKLRRDDGSAALEFISAGLILLVPVLYVVITFAQVQDAQLAVESAASSAARSFVRSPSSGTAATRAQDAVRLSLLDYGLTPAQATVAVSCSAGPDRCLDRGQRVTVRVGATVPLPFLPTAWPVTRALSVPVSATATAPVARLEVQR
jgi:Flp pilus assembly protein TadG